MNSIFIDDVGTSIRIKVSNKDISSGANYRLYYHSPSGDTGFYPAALRDTDTIEYIVQPADFNEEGHWKLQGYVELPGWSGYTGIIDVFIKKNIGG